MGWNEAAAAHIQNSIAGTERNGMGAQCGAREGEGRGELGWANAVAAGAPPLPGWLISSISLVCCLFLPPGSLINKRKVY